MTIPAPLQRFIIPDLPTTDELLPYLRQIDANRWYSNFGPLANLFEERFAETMALAHGGGTPQHCVVMSSGYYALNVGLRLLGVQEGMKVLIPSVTFPACPLAAQNIGAESVLSDVDPQSWLLTPAIARAAAERNKIDAVMPVCVYGMAAPAEEWDAFTRDTGIPVLIDAAAAIESQRYLQRGAVAHSLHALKPFGIGEGGLLITPDFETATKARQYINFGMKDRITYIGGENAKMSEYHAAVGLAQMDRWEDIKRRRMGVLQTYLKVVEGIDGMMPHPALTQTVPSCLMVTLDKPVSAALCQTLQKNNVAAHRTYLPPLYAHPHFAGMKMIAPDGHLTTDRAAMTGSEHMDKYVLGLPFHSFLQESDMRTIAATIAKHLAAA